MDDIMTLVNVIEDLRITRYTNAAATTLYVHDIFVTMDQEVEHIWTRLSFDLPTIFYIINRYICLPFFLFGTYAFAGFHDPFTDDECKQGKQMIGLVLATVAGSGVMTIRVCALWRQTKWLVRTVWALWTCLIVITVVNLYMIREKVNPGITYNAYIGMCVAAVSPLLLAVSPIPPTVYTLCLTLLTIIKAFNFQGYSSGLTLPRLYHVLARDGVAYFVISGVISIGNMTNWLASPPSRLTCFLYLYWACSSIVISRMVLNLRAIYMRSLLDQTVTDGISTNAVIGTRDTAGPWHHGRRFVNGEGYLGVDNAGVSRPMEEEPWNVEIYDVPSSNSIRLQDVDIAGGDTRDQRREYTTS